MYLDPQTVIETGETALEVIGGCTVLYGIGKSLMKMYRALSSKAPAAETKTETAAPAAAPAEAAA